MLLRHTSQEDGTVDCSSPAKSVYIPIPRENGTVIRKPRLVSTPELGFRACASDVGAVALVDADVRDAGPDDTAPVLGAVVADEEDDAAVLACIDDVCQAETPGVGFVVGG